MPNWCNNSITISGPKDKIKALWEQANQEGNGLLNAMVPQPENIFQGNLGEAEEQMCKEQGIPNWYDWNIANWGTKWDIPVPGEGLELVEHSDGTASIDGWFDSAWAPPTTAYDTFLEANPDCDIEAWYDEPGMVFCGKYVNGVDDCYEYSGYTSENIYESMPSEIVDYWDLQGRLAEYEEWDKEEA